MADEKEPFGEFDARLRRLRETETTSRRPEPQEPQRLSWGGGLQAGVELLAGILGGLLIGYGLDWLFGTKPLFIIVLFLLGAAAGMLNAYRFLRRMQDSGGP